MEKFKLAKYIHSEQAIFNLAMKELPMEYAKALNVFLQDVMPQVNEFKDFNEKIIKEKYGVEKDGMWTIKEDMIGEFNETIRPLLEKDLVVDVPQLSFEKLANMGCTISANDLVRLENFLIYS